MKIQIDGKLLISKGDMISVYSKEMLMQEFKISKNNFNELSIVKFDNIKVDLIYKDFTYDKRNRKTRGEVSIINKNKAKYITDNIIVTNKSIRFDDDGKYKIELAKIKVIDVHTDHLNIITNNNTFQIKTNSFKFNIYMISLLEWIESNQIDDRYIGKKIKFQLETK